MAKFISKKAQEVDAPVAASAPLAASTASEPSPEPSLATDPAPISASTQVDAEIPIRTRQAGKRRYRVWAHGALLRNDVLYPAGSEVELPPAVAASLACVEPLD